MRHEATVRLALVASAVIALLGTAAAHASTNAPNTNTDPNFQISSAPACPWQRHQPEWQQNGCPWQDNDPRWRDHPGPRWS